MQMGALWDFQKHIARFNSQQDQSSSSQYDERKLNTFINLAHGDQKPPVN